MIHRTIILSICRRFWTAEFERRTPDCWLIKQLWTLRFFMKILLGILDSRVVYFYELRTQNGVWVLRLCCFRIVFLSRVLLLFFWLEVDGCIVSLSSSFTWVALPWSLSWIRLSELYWISAQRYDYFQLKTDFGVCVFV